ncbi:MAG: hypothetical protein FIB08_10690 [Candidatus Methanoperedens sp.]|nr:hypothetical protein [Candidatus Methanoperedens sp.]
MKAPKVKFLNSNMSCRIDYLRALEKACLNCGDKHQADCPVGMAKAQIKCTNDLLVEFYRQK